MPSPERTLALAYEQALEQPEQPFIEDATVVQQIEYVCRNRNRSGTRLLLSCLIAFLEDPSRDIRKPYTEINGDDTFSGRYYDETYVTEFVSAHDLPCNPTTAFLTPAWRNNNRPLTTDLIIEGRPRRLYTTVLELLDAVHHQRFSAEQLLHEIVRWLIVIRDEQDQRLETLLADLRASQDDIPLSSEAIVRIISQHLAQPRSSRLPVLVFAAAYKTLSRYFDERIRPLTAHTAADSQTSAMGDLEIILADDDTIRTAYEMKTRQITRNDIEHALQKVLHASSIVENYIFVTTESIDEDVIEFAAGLYEQTGGIEFVILDCVGFLRHFLHFFHRMRVVFLEHYQQLVLEEPESAVSQPLKEVFLTLRRANSSQ